LAGLTRQSILFFEKGWTRGSSPRVTGEDGSLLSCSDIATALELSPTDRCFDFADL